MVIKAFLGLGCSLLAACSDAVQEQLPLAEGIFAAAVMDHHVVLELNQDGTALYAARGPSPEIMMDWSGQWELEYREEKMVVVTNFANDRRLEWLWMPNREGVLQRNGTLWPTNLQGESPLEMGRMELSFAGSAFGEAYRFDSAEMLVMVLLHPKGKATFIQDRFSSEGQLNISCTWEESEPDLVVLQGVEEKCTPEQQRFLPGLRFLRREHEGVPILVSEGFAQEYEAGQLDGTGMLWPISGSKSGAFCHQKGKGTELYLRPLE